jgi:hypothetical protein
MDTVSPIGISRQMCAAEWRTVADWLATQRSPNARKLVPLIRQAVADLPDTKGVTFAAAETKYDGWVVKAALATGAY